MNTLETVQQLKKKIGDAFLAESNFLDQVTVEVSKERLRDALTYLKTEHGYETLMDLTGVDYLQPTKRTKVVYLLRNPTTLERILLYLYAASDEVIPSVTDIWEGADWYERELYDLFGVKIANHPNLKRILMPEDWEGYPLRKDYALTEEPVQFKNGAKPKIPSEIIPYVKDWRKS